MLVIAKLLRYVTFLVNATVKTNLAISFSQYHHQMFFDKSLATR